MTGDPVCLKLGFPDGHYLYNKRGFSEYMKESTSAPQDYRARIYEHYASNFQNAPQTFNIEAARRWGGAYRYYLRDWLPNDKGAHILDVACGGGKLLQFFRDTGYNNVYGVDISPEQVALARQVTLNIVEANVLDYLAENRGRFDLITGLDIVEHFRKDEVLRFLDLCFAALKPGGRLVLQTPNAESQWGTHHRYNDLTHELGFNPDALNRLLALVGFDAIQARELGPIPFGYSVASTLRWLMWEAIRVGLKVWNLAEIGNTGSRIFTRNFLICARRGC